jgi:RHS repeat-associated protein
VTFTHTYNRANQRVGQTVTDNSWLNYPAATPTVNYTSNALNQYSAVGAVSPTYDGNGNLTSDGTFTFGYDAENRLTSAVGGTNTAAYTYDAQGRRKTKTVNGATTVFVTDAANREVLEYDGSSGAIQRWYAYGLGSNDVLNQMNVVAATRVALIPDIQGSVIASLDSSSGTLGKIGYLPYGKSAGATAPFGYTGQRIDPETSGLYYYRARNYSPAWGRFWQPDPIGYDGGINLYAYVGNDPLNFADPDGLVQDAIRSAGNFVLNNPGQVLGAALVGAGIVACTLSPCVAGELALAGDTAVGGVTLTATGVNAGAAIVGGTILMNQNDNESPATSPYARPSNATTAAQRASVQGQPCVDCGATGPMNANHIEPLVQEYYRTGTIDLQQMRSLNAVSAQCPTCSASQGGLMAAFSRSMKSLLGF